MQGDWLVRVLEALTCLARRARDGKGHDVSCNELGRGGVTDAEMCQNIFWRNNFVAVFPTALVVRPGQPVIMLCVTVPLARVSFPFHKGL